MAREIRSVFLKKSKVIILVLIYSRCELVVLLNAACTLFSMHFTVVIVSQILRQSIENVIIVNGY